MKFLLLLLLVFILLCTPGQGQNVFMNEIQSNDSSTDDAEFIELIGPAGADISGWSITHFNGTGGVAVFTFTFPDSTIFPDDGIQDRSGQAVGFIVIRHTGHLVPNADLEWGTVGLQNGPDGIELLDRDGMRRQALTWNGLGDLSGGLPPWRNIGTDNNDDLSLSAPDEVAESFQNSWSNVAATPGTINTNQLSGDISLPVQLLYFTAGAGDAEVKLHWATGAEINNLGFIIDRSLEKEGVYEELASHETYPELKGAGNSSTPRQYSFQDQTVFNGLTYYYKLSDVDLNGVRREHGPVWATPIAARIDPDNEKPASVKPEYILRQNYPNPFNPSTRIGIEISALDESPVDLSIYNLAGQKIVTLLTGLPAQTSFEMEWNGLNVTGQPVAAGVYFYVLRTPTYYSVNKMILVR